MARKMIGVPLLFVPLVVGPAWAAPPPADLAMRWTIESNVYPPASQEPHSIGALVLRNLGDRPLGESGWSVWFTSAGAIVPGDVGDHLRIDFENGSLYRLSPSNGFRGIAPGQDQIVHLPYAALVFKDSEAPLGPYVVLDDAPDVGRPVVRYEIEPRTGTAQLPRWPGGIPAVVTPAEIYARNAKITDLPVDRLPPVFPTPVDARRLPGSVHWTRRPSVEASPSLAAEAKLAERLFDPLLPITTDASRELPLRLAIGAVADHRGPEAYALEVDPVRGVRITGTTAAGVSRGLQSLRALLPAHADANGVEIAAWTIRDEPRFGYRGLAVDLARNFQPPRFVFRYLDLMARYKLNVLHMHLTDDEGWRLEISELPELTEVGSRRGHTTDPLRHLPPAHGSGPDVNDPHGSGYLTREDFKAILRHAAALQIEVIPEIEMPGHARAAVKAMASRAHRVASGGAASAVDYRLDDPLDQSQYESAQSFNDNVMNPGLESTYAFIDHVIGDVVSMYREAGVPLRTIHVGGDELPAGAWARSPACDELKRRHHLASTADVWNYFYGRIDRLLKARGLRASGWEEMGARRVSMHGAPKLIPNPYFVHAGMTVYVWNNLDGATDLGVRLANAGYRTVLAPVSAFYFDMAYNRDPDEPGGKWAPFTELEDAYDFVPYDFVRASATDPTPVPGRDGLADIGRDNIAGLEGELWSESLRTVDRIDYMLLPRLLGLAERAWAADPDWARAPDRASAEPLHAAAWSTFVNQVGKQVLPRLDAEDAGVHYRIPTPGLVGDGGQVHANLQLPGFVLRYTTDGTDPTADSRRVEGALSERARIRVTAFDATGRHGRVSEIDNR